MTAVGRDSGRHGGHEFGNVSLSRCTRCGCVRARKGYGWQYAPSMDGPWTTELPPCSEPNVKNPWRNRQILFFDLETTGLDWRASVVTEIAMVRGKVSSDGTVTVLDEMNSLVYVPDEFVDQAMETAQITGITIEMLADAPVLQSVLHSVDYFVSQAPADTLVASYNASFDVPFLGSTYLRAERAMPKLLLNEIVLDPLVWSRKLDKYDRGGHKLGTVAMKKGLVDEEELARAHRADFDAELGLRVLGAFSSRVPQDLDELWHWQRAARGEWENSFFNFLLKKKKEEQ